MYWSTCGAPRKYFGFFSSTTCWPGVKLLKMNGPMDAGGLLFRALSSMFLLVSVVLLSHTALNFALGRMPPAPAPPSAAMAGQKVLLSVMVMVLPSTLMPEIESVLPSP